MTIIKIFVNAEQWMDMQIKKEKHFLLEQKSYFLLVSKKLLNIQTSQKQLMSVVFIRFFGVSWQLWGKNW